MLKHFACQIIRHFDGKQNETKIRSPSRPDRETILENIVDCGLCSYTDIKMTTSTKNRDLRVDIGNSVRRHCKTGSDVTLSCNI